MSRTHPWKNKDMKYLSERKKGGIYWTPWIVALLVWVVINLVYEGLYG